MANVNRRDLITILAALGMGAAASASQHDGEQNAGTRNEMKVGRVYATPDGESHIGDLEIRLTENQGRPLFFNSARFGATAVGFQRVRAGGVTAWHNPPQRWLAMILSGTWEIEVSDGTRRQFPAGSVSLVEDTFGKGHRGRAVGDSEVLVASVVLNPEQRIVG